MFCRGKTVTIRGKIGNLCGIFSIVLLMESGSKAGRNLKGRGRMDKYAFDVRILGKVGKKGKPICK